jgi:hypothetical protein
VSGSRPSYVGVGAALSLLALLLCAGPALARVSGKPQALAIVGLQPTTASLSGAAESQDIRDAPAGNEEVRDRVPDGNEGLRGNASGGDQRDRRLLAALIFTVIGTIGLITIGSVVLLTQPGDRHVMVVAEPADGLEEQSENRLKDGEDFTTKHHLSE